MKFKNFLGRLDRRGRRRAPMFPPELWSVYERVLNDQERTNNNAEAAHRRLQIELGMDHPTLWKFIDGLKKVQKGCDIRYEQYVRGDAPPHKRLKYIQCDQRIRTIVESYLERNKLEYLRGISQNFLME